MSHYFLLLDASEFHDQFRPALSASWRNRSFAPLRDLSAVLLPRIRDFATRFHLGPDEPLLAQVAAGLPFDRTLWRYLVGEVLWYGAVDIPELPTAEQALVCLLAPRAPQISEDRSSAPPIQQAHRGSRDLVFGGGFYRPDHAGWNDSDDVQRLAVYLAAVTMDAWRPEDLAALTELSDEDRVEELADAREWFPALAALYRRAAEDRRVLVCEAL
jgi:hypothetical protein